VNGLGKWLEEQYRNYNLVKYVNLGDSLMMHK